MPRRLTPGSAGVLARIPRRLTPGSAGVSQRLRVSVGAAKSHPWERGRPARIPRRLTPGSAGVAPACPSATRVPGTPHLWERGRRARIPRRLTPGSACILPASPAVSPLGARASSPACPPLQVQERTEHMSALRLCRSRMRHPGSVPSAERRASGRIPCAGFGRPCRMIQPRWLPADGGALIPPQPLPAGIASQAEPTVTASPTPTATAPPPARDGLRCGVHSERQRNARRQRQPQHQALLMRQFA
jgi:hypothetical protein